MELNLKNKVAVVTGGGNGIGRAAALKFAEEGAFPVICDIEMDSAEKVVKEIREKGGSAYAYHVDVTEPDQIDVMVKAVITKLGRIDVLVNNAGIGLSNPVWDLPEEEWDRVVDISLKGTFLCSKAIVKHMMARKSGKIVNISSTDRIHCFIEGISSVHYTSAKAGITGFTRQMALEVAEYGINVNCVAPGHTKVERYLDRVKSAGMNWEDFEDEMFSKIPLKRFATPEDQANAIVFLSSDAAKHITGATLDVNGGLVMV